MPVVRILFPVVLLCIALSGSNAEPCPDCVYYMLMYNADGGGIHRGVNTLSKIKALHQVFVGLDFENTTDPCNNNPGDACGQNSECLPYSEDVTFYNCSCRSGNFEEIRESQRFACLDVDECGDGTDDCPETAVCNNTPGSFECRCPEGFTVVDTSCADVDECEEGTDDCPENSACNNTLGSFECNCVEGFTGVGTSCVAVTTSTPLNTTTTTSTTTTTAPTAATTTPDTTTTTTTDTTTTISTIPTTTATTAIPSTTGSTSTTPQTTTTTKSFLAQLAERRMSLWMKIRKLKIKSYRRYTNFPKTRMDGRPYFKPRCL